MDNQTAWEQLMTKRKRDAIQKYFERFLERHAGPVNTEDTRTALIEQVNNYMGGLIAQGLMDHMTGVHYGYRHEYAGANVTMNDNGTANVTVTWQPILADAFRHVDRVNGYRNAYLYQDDPALEGNVRE